VENEGQSLIPSGSSVSEEVSPTLIGSSSRGRHLSEPRLQPHGRSQLGRGVAALHW